MSTTRDEQRIEEIKGKLIAAAVEYAESGGEFKSYRKSFTELVKQAVDAGATPEEVHEWGAAAQLTRQAVNKALREAGVRQRAERSDKGKSKSDPINTDPVQQMIPSSVPTPEFWAADLLALMGSDYGKAADFISKMLDHVMAKQSEALGRAA